MECLKKWIKLRKQNDIVKILFLIFAVAVFFLAYALYNCFLLYGKMENSVEYIMTADSGKKTSIQEIVNSDADNRINAASFQQEYAFTVKLQGSSATFTAFGLSGEYIKSVYGIDKVGAMKKIYMNKKAYANLCRQLNITKIREENNKLTSLRVSYSAVSSFQQSMEAEEKGTVEIALVEENINNEEPFAFYILNSPCNTAENQIRVDINNNRFGQKNEQKFEMPGFTVENNAQIEKRQFQQEIIALKIKYSFITAFISLVCVLALKKSLAQKN